MEEKRNINTIIYNVCYKNKNEHSGGRNSSSEFLLFQTFLIYIFHQCLVSSAFHLHFQALFWKIYGMLKSTNKLLFKLMWVVTRLSDLPFLSAGNRYMHLEHQCMLSHGVKSSSLMYGLFLDGTRHLLFID